METAQARKPKHLDFARLLSIRVDQGLFDAIEQDAALQHIKRHPEAYAEPRPLSRALTKRRGGYAGNAPLHRLHPPISGLTPPRLCPQAAGG